MQFDVSIRAALLLIVSLGKMGLQERMERSFLTCRDKVEAYGGSIEGDEAKLQQMEQCMGTSLKEHMKTLPHLASSIQTKIGISK